MTAIRLAVVDDFQIVVAGVARMLEPFGDRVEVVEINANTTPELPVDLALYDGFAQGQADHQDLQPLLDDSDVGGVVMYTWNFDPALVAEARRRRLAGYLAKSSPADRLVGDIERIHGGEFVVSDPPPSGRITAPGDWPGRTFGLTERESEVLALMLRGLDTDGVAERLYLSRNSIKSHTQSLYRRLGVHNRTQAVLWGIDHGFRPDRDREAFPND